MGAVTLFGVQIPVEVLGIGEPHHLKCELHNDQKSKKIKSMKSIDEQFVQSSKMAFAKLDIQHSSYEKQY